MSRDTPAAKPIIAAEIAALVRHELMGVVENGTGRRARKSIVSSNGKMVPAGDKTGTGDNRLEIFGVGYEIGSKW